MSSIFSKAKRMRGLQRSSVILATTNTDERTIPQTRSILDAKRAARRGSLSTFLCEAFALFDAAEGVGRQGNVGTFTTFDPSKSSEVEGAVRGIP